jgi:hypothetical protein
MRNSFIALIGKPELQSILGRISGVWHDNIKMWAK